MKNYIKNWRKIASKFIIFATLGIFWVLLFVVFGYYAFVAAVSVLSAYKEYYTYFNYTLLTLFVVFAWAWLYMWAEKNKD